MSDTDLIAEPEQPEYQPRCWHCNEPGPIVCNAPECQQRDREWQKDRERVHRIAIRKAVKAAIVQRCKPEGDLQLGRLERWFYTLKCLLCVLFCRERDYGKTAGYPEKVEVGQYHFARLYAGWESEWISVGYGVFSQWWYELDRDGDWWM